MAGITDVLMNAYAMESADLRARKCGREHAVDMAAVFASEAMDAIEISARTVLAACSEGDELRTNLGRAAALHQARHGGHDRAAAQDRGAMLDAGRYVV